MANLYKRIDDLCKANGTSITKMCKEIGISRSTLSELNSGRTKKLSADNLAKIANYFRIRVDVLIEENTVKRSNDKIMNNILVLLEKKNKTIEELCKYLDISEYTFEDWIKGEDKTYNLYLPHIAEFFNVTVDEIVGREKDDSTTAIILGKGFGLKTQKIPPQQNKKTSENNSEDIKKGINIVIFSDTYGMETIEIDNNDLETVRSMLKGLELKFKNQ